IPELVDPAESVAQILQSDLSSRTPLAQPPGASPALVMGYRACRWVKQSLRQELSLSGGCLVTLMENELWQTIPQKPLPQLAGSSESPSAMGWGGEAAPRRAVTEAPMHA
ncbi:Hypothetical predicted protein, partial [Marmota monax]